jgi:NADPH-dependent glutamate synthase beta subunit-like oxidoreductase/NAD(P)H-flavin reductase
MSATETATHFPTGAAGRAKHDFALGVPGFHFSDLNRVRRLEALDGAFREDLAARDAALAARFEEWRGPAGAGWPRKQESELLVAVAPHLGRFVARLFRIEAEVESLDAWTREEGKLFDWQKRFLFPKVLRRPPSPEQLAAMDVAALRAAYDDVLRRHHPSAPAADPERALGEVGLLLMARKDEAAKRDLAAIEAWASALKYHPSLKAETRDWATFKHPEPLHFERLVPTIRPYGDLREKFEGPLEHRRARDGFALTDERMTRRQALQEVHYCIYCHRSGNDKCSRGFEDPSAPGGYRANPLGIPLEGCPLEEKISEAHALKRAGATIGALAVVMIDNPLCAGTGHRICNDCMKSCIYDEKEPVNIPQAETRILTDVLGLPYGVEVYGLLTRWNPLLRARPTPLPYNGKNVLVVGMGPAGYTLAHHLVNEGFGVVGIDALKIEPLSVDLVGARRRSPRPIRDWRALLQRLDERILLGFGGVSEYGITVRWDKNFLDLIYLTLLRRKKFRLFGGVRFGGTITIEDAWRMGFDHIALATGAGRPTIVPMKNNLIRGVRAASDFLMALQLSGAAKRNGLANLEVRLPAVVIGGGLTGIDAATETLAYYVVEVEKTLDRFERLAAKIGAERIAARMTPEERATIEELLAHGRAVREERARAAAEGRRPDFAPLLKAWGGVTIVYRKRLQDSPAYRLNHEEVQKALEEGIGFVECHAPLEVVPDAAGCAAALVCERQVEEGGKWRGTGERRTIPARAVFIAAGTHPNSVYEKERPGTFERDRWGEFYLGFKAVKGPGGRISLARAAEGETGFFTSYERDGRLISYYGDNHPDYEGNVVKAMASAKHGFRAVAALFADEVAAQRREDQLEREERWAIFADGLKRELTATVVDVLRLTPTIVEVIVRAPAAARNFKPGQFYRLQNYETLAPEVEGFRLMMEGLALTGAWVDQQRGLLSMIVLEMGHSSRLCSVLEPGEKVVVMGPTGAPTEIPEGETVLLAGGGLGNAVLFSIAAACKAKGCRVVYFAGYKSAGDVFKMSEIERSTDVVVWSVDRGPAIEPRRPQDRSLVGNIVQAMDAYARGELGPAPVPLRDVTRIISIGSDRMMNAVRVARKERLACHLRPDHVAIGSINSPMQCMMKEVCAQCLQKHVDPRTGAEKGVVFSCFNQDQNLDEVDFAHLAERLKLNGASEKLTDLWLDHLFERRAVTGA